MRRCLTLSLGLLFAFSAVAEGAVPCGPPDARTIRQTEDARVYAFAYSQRAACVLGVRPVRLTDPRDEDSDVHDSSIRLRGSFVSWTGSRRDRFDEDHPLLARANLRTRRTTILSNERVWSHILRPSGSVAWIEEAWLIDAAWRFRVRKREGGRTARLDQGSRIYRTSLRLTGTRLSWVEDGRRKYSTLR